MKDKNNNQHINDIIESCYRKYLRCEEKKEDTNSNKYVDPISKAISMAQKNPGAISIILEMLAEDPVYFYICDIYNIKGHKIWMLFKDCSGQNLNKLYRTLDMIGQDVFTQEEIDANFDMTYAIPFIDDNIIVDGMPSYEENIKIPNEIWNEYCRVQSEAFREKISIRRK